MNINDETFPILAFADNIEYTVKYTYKPEVEIILNKIKKLIEELVEERDSKISDCTNLNKLDNIFDRRYKDIEITNIIETYEEEINRLTLDINIIMSRSFPSIVIEMNVKD